MVAVARTPPRRGRLTLTSTPPTTRGSLTPTTLTIRDPPSAPDWFSRRLTFSIDEETGRSRLDPSSSPTPSTESTLCTSDGTVVNLPSWIRAVLRAHRRGRGRSLRPSPSRRGRGRPSHPLPDNIQEIKKEGCRTIYRCTLCRTTAKVSDYVTKYNAIKYHSVCQTGGRYPFNCGQCDKKFATKGNWHLHIRTHAEKNMLCPEPRCGKMFNRRDGLTAHLKKVHPQIWELERRQRQLDLETGANFRCLKEGCGKRFKRLQILKNHQKTHLPVPEDCNVVKRLVTNLRDREYPGRRRGRGRRVQSPRNGTCGVSRNAERMSRMIQAVKHHTRVMLSQRLPCPIPGCDGVFPRGGNELIHHLQDFHGKRSTVAMKMWISAEQAFTKELKSKKKNPTSTNCYVGEGEGIGHQLDVDNGPDSSSSSMDSSTGVTDGDISLAETEVATENESGIEDSDADAADAGNNEGLDTEGEIGTDDGENGTDSNDGENGSGQNDTDRNDEGVEDNVEEDSEDNEDESPPASTSFFMKLVNYLGF